MPYALCLMPQTESSLPPTSLSVCSQTDLMTNMAMMLKDVTFSDLFRDLRTAFCIQLSHGQSATCTTAAEILLPRTFSLARALSLARSLSLPFSLFLSVSFSPSPPARPPSHRPSCVTYSLPSLFTVLSRAPSQSVTPPLMLFPPPCFLSPFSPSQSLSLPAFCVSLGPMLAPIFAAVIIRNLCVRLLSLTRND
jgi:hypothetical protein